MKKNKKGIMLREYGIYNIGTTFNIDQLPIIKNRTIPIAEMCFTKDGNPYYVLYLDFFNALRIRIAILFKRRIYKAIRFRRIK